MSRDSEIQQVFEIADDSLQGMIGYHMYVDALQKAVKEKELLHWLPDQRFQMTFSWDRFYQKQDLVKAFEVEISELYQCKLLLVEVTNVFEASLKDFIDLLKQKSFPQLHGGKKIARNYKSYITWAFNQARKCDVGDKKAIERLSGTFGTIDNTRRLRNLIVHNHWVFNSFYEEDVIIQEGIQNEMHPFYEKFKEDTKRMVPVVVDWSYLRRLILAHIEVLHILHNSIQKNFFGVNEGYSYAKEQKPIYWQRAIWGKVNVKVQKAEKRLSS